MPIDYRKVKTPFFEVSIGDSKGQRMVKLPHHIKRLISKVEIIETFELDSVNTVNIEFIEGSREPASQDAELGTDGLYQINSFETGETDVNVSGSVTNRPGLITDLRFSGTQGISFISSTEKRNKAIDESLQRNVIGNNVTRAYATEDKRPRFLFQERNQVKIKWGYLEDPDTQRTIRTYILTVAVRYPSSGQITTTVSCQDTNAVLEQIAPTKGISFGRRIRTGENQSIVDIEDEDVGEMVKRICDSSGMDCDISSNLHMPVFDNNHEKVWLSGQSFTNFMTELARQNHAYFKVTPNPDTGVDTLLFIKKSEFERRVLVGKDLLTYRAPGTIIKDVDIKVDFGIPSGNAQTGVDKEGDNVAFSIEDSSASVTEVMFKNGDKKEVITDNFPTKGTNAVLAAQGLEDNVAGKGNISGTVDNNPTEDIDLKDKFAGWIQADQQRVIQADFTTIGFTKLTPGTVDLAGLGVRYSGKYRVLTSTHTITADSYETRCSATSMALGSGGLIAPSADYKEDEDVPEEKQIRASLFERVLDRK